jgi:hypothetical protein
MMMSSLKLNTQTFIGREEEKKINQIISYLMDLPEAAEFLHPVDWEGSYHLIKNSNSTTTRWSSNTP